MLLSDFLLTDKIALVTGSGRGLGLEIAKTFAKAGALVLVNGRTAQTVQQAAAAIGTLAHPLPFDVTDETAVAQAFDHIRQAYGRLGYPG